MLLLLIPALHAELPPLTYLEELSSRAGTTAELMNAEGYFERCIEWSKEFQAVVAPSAALEYELAYAYSGLGELDKARKHYWKSTELDPSYAASWYDLGELEMAEGDLDAAKVCFTRAAELRPDHWAGSFRLAELAARKGDPVELEKQLRVALRAGFSFSVIVNDPNWRQIYKDPALGEVIRRLITVYSDQRLLEELEK